MEHILVFGHKNPDTDSICSSIAMAALRSRQGKKAKAYRLGETSKETGFVLKHFGIKEPKLLQTVSAQIGDLNYIETKTIGMDDSIQEALELMTKKNFSSLPVIDREGYLKSMLHVSEIANTYLEIDYSDLFSKYSTTFENLKEVLRGNVISGQYPSGNINSNLKEVSELDSMQAGDIVITTSLTDGIDKAIQAGARVVIVCCKETDFISPRVTSDCAIMLVKHSFFKAISLISQSISVGGIVVEKDVVCLNTESYLNKVREEMKMVSQTNFPVLDEDGKVFGTIRTKNLIDFQRKEVIMVDHNEFSQSVDGIQDAHILEVVDHHKFANFHTNEATRIRTEAVGCSSTIVYSLYEEAGLVPEAKIAGLMLSAILSDTLLFQSPTCTPKDIATAKALAKIAGVEDMKAYGMEMLTAGTSLGDATVKELLNQDKKVFPLTKKIEMAVAQVNCIDVKELAERKAEIADRMEYEIGKYGYALFLLVVTDIIHSNSLVYAYGDLTKLVEEGFHKKLENNEVVLENVVSRKKQIIPALMAASQNL